MLQKKKTVYILFNEMNSRYRFRAAKFVIQSGFVPTYPTIVGDFFEDIATRRQDKDSLIRNCNEVWVFGEVSSGMSDQINVAKHLGKRVKFYSVAGDQFTESDADGKMQE